RALESRRTRGPASSVRARGAIWGVVPMAAAGMTKLAIERRTGEMASMSPARCPSMRRAQSNGLVDSERGEGLASSAALALSPPFDLSDFRDPGAIVTLPGCR